MIPYVITAALGFGLLRSIVNLVIWLQTGQPDFLPGNTPVSEAVTHPVVE